MKQQYSMAIAGVFLYHRGRRYTRSRFLVGTAVEKGKKIMSNLEVCLDPIDAARLVFVTCATCKPHGNESHSR